MALLAGTGVRGLIGASNRDVGAVGAPDIDQFFEDAPHCTNADYFATPGYPQTRFDATVALRQCHDEAQRHFRQAAIWANDLVDLQGNIVSAAVQTPSCEFVDWRKAAAALHTYLTRPRPWLSMLPSPIQLGIKGVVRAFTGIVSLGARAATPGPVPGGAAKCVVLYHLGRSLHAIEDFWSHSNWGDHQDATRPISIQNPQGLGRPGRAPFMNMLGPMPNPPVPLSTACYDLVHGCAGRIDHDADISKDMGTIIVNYYVGGKLPNIVRSSAPTTPRGQIGTGSNNNFHLAVVGAVNEAYGAWTDFGSDLVATYGKRRGEMMICALTHDDPVKSCTTTVAYVTDFGTGLSDTSGPGQGSSIFVNALTGSPLTSGATYNGDKFVDVPVSAIDASPNTALDAFDIAIVYQVCDLANHPNTIRAINAFVDAGGKVLIFDADRCANAPGAAMAVSYAGFVFPFATSSPGPQGQSGSYLKVIPSTLTTGLAAGSVPGDAIGDSNTFTTFDPHWCASITATNQLNNTGYVEAYARTAPGDGLIVYDGEDFWFTYGPTPHLRQVFDLMLAQPWNPDGLPYGGTCQLPATNIDLSPAAQTVSTRSAATVTAHVIDVAGNPVQGIKVTFTVTAGPNAGASGTGTSDPSGTASFTYTDAAGKVGVDTVQATFVDSSGNSHVSNTVQIRWT